LPLKQKDILTAFLESAWVPMEEILHYLVGLSRYYPVICGVS
jgi:hypothetical protein